MSSPYEITTLILIFLYSFVLFFLFFSSSFCLFPFSFFLGFFLFFCIYSFIYFSSLFFSLSCVSSSRLLLPLSTHFVEIFSCPLFCRFLLFIPSPSSFSGIEDVSQTVNQNERKKQKAKIRMKEKNYKIGEGKGRGRSDKKNSNERKNFLLCLIRNGRKKREFV